MNIDYLIDAENNKRTLIFDLDNTLYDEFNYIELAYKEVANCYSSQNKKEAFDYLLSEFKEGRRQGLFNRLISKYPESPNLLDILNVFRNPKYVKLNFYPWFQYFLSVVSLNFKLLILTNGNVEQQKKKVNMLGVENLECFEECIFANEYEPKPSIKSYDMFTKVETFNSPIYIGDSDVDLIFSKRLGIEYFDVKNLYGDTL